MTMGYPGWFKHSDTERHPLVGKYIKVWWGGAEAGRIHQIEWHDWLDQHRTDLERRLAA